MNPELDPQLNAFKGEYWRTMGKVSAGLNIFATQYACAKSDSATRRYTQKRCHLIGLKFYAGYLAGGGTEVRWEDHQLLAIALELVMTSAYAANQILDHKKAVWDAPGGIEQALLDYLFLQTWQSDLIERWTSLSQLDEQYTKRVKWLMSQLAEKMTLGFGVERELSVRHRPLNQMTSSRFWWAQRYQERNTSLNLVYDWAPLIGHDIARTEVRGYEERLDTVGHHYDFFGNCIPFSHSMQVINDIADFLPNACDLGVKVYQDRFADVRNGLVTYPVHELLDVPQMVEVLRDGDVENSGWQDYMIKLVKERGIMDKAKEQCERSWYHHLTFWKWILRRHDLLLLSTYSMLRHNKYFKSIE
ncbi:MAG TPA: hypothetical protein VGE59_02860 [Patescibacteria group bacterium]